MSTAPDLGSIPEWTFGDRLRKIRRQLGVDQRVFAEMLGENPKTCAAWELDTTAPRDPVAVARRVEVISGVPAAWLLGVHDGSPFRGNPQTPGHESHATNYGYPDEITPTRHLQLVTTRPDETAVTEPAAA